jgi:hypothetical protein
VVVVQGPDVVLEGPDVVLGGTLFFNEAQDRRSEARTRQPRTTRSTASTSRLAVKLPREEEHLVRVGHVVVDVEQQRDR